MRTCGSARRSSTVTRSLAASGWPAGRQATGVPSMSRSATSVGGTSSPGSTLTRPRSSDPSARPCWMSTCRPLTTSTPPEPWRACRSRRAGARRLADAVTTVPMRRSRRRADCWPAAWRSRSTASRTSVMFWSRSSPCRLIRDPVRRRSSSVVPSSFSSLVTASLSAGWEMCIASLARRSEPCSVTAARYSSCSIRTLCSCRGVWSGCLGGAVGSVGSRGGRQNLLPGVRVRDVDSLKSTK